MEPSTVCVVLGHEARTLTVEETNKLQDDCELINDFKQKKLEEEAKKHWDKFYLRNTTKFFKDRHWTTREFEELVADDLRKCDRSENKPVLLEVGCGVGNTILPLLESDCCFQVLACDFSSRAVSLLSSNKTFSSSGSRAFVCDLTTNELFRETSPCSVNIVTMIFMLSSVHPDKMRAVLRNVLEVLVPGGLLLFRDYGLYDQAQLRFKKGHKLSENFYARQDGTRAYYFSREVAKKLFEDVGFYTQSIEYVSRRTVNWKENIDVPRVFVQAKFAKPKRAS